MKYFVLGTAVSAAAMASLTARTMMTPNAPAPEVMVRAAELSQPPAEPSSLDLSVTFATEVVNRNATLAPLLHSSDFTRPDELTAVTQALAIPAWEATVTDGDTLESILTRADMDAPLRAEVALAIAAEYDLRRLRPGHQLRVNFQPNGSPSFVALTVDEGVQIEVTLDGKVAGRTRPPVLTSVEQAGQLVVSGSIYTSLDAAGIPARFAVDLAEILSDAIDFRRDLKGGEKLDIQWAQSVLADGSKVGQPKLTYAALDLAKDIFEVVWSDEDSGKATVYLNGDVLRRIAPPVKGARLSSVFGRRKHPIYGNVRMHTGVDYAAAKGTPISATAPGRVSFIGWQNGYGQVVEISHGSNTMTRYAHLSAVPNGLKTGNRVLAGEVIGQVGETGTATAPNLHYEVRIDGRPINPLGKELIASVENSDTAGASALLERTRALFTATLSDEI
ncbi:M23 family metallopeptidase [Roseobacter sp. N2S]|uniref:M23 family metallopeptidase n=1 Tax=Roseobacter sp. N2S TaxID=2663844 RepID=UPI0028599769|nr:M23 family metallopeptidase [Roseobacter sp. N2S]MDR6267302.1 murein DD-endopeptidase MepM/ murein hydrolase activator NlpD [Roseobacter sp. N2S]